jgi:hypothetical protein
MSKKPKLDIRTMIREGKISTDRAGQLIALDNYAGGILTDSDERALRETVKDNQRMNYYINGSNKLNRVEVALQMEMLEIDRDINWVAWALSAIMYTTVLDNTIPAVQIVTQEKYDRIPEEKHTQRKARTYNLMALYRAVLEDIIQNRRKDYKAIVDDLERTAKEGREGQHLVDAETDEEQHLLYGMDLIDNASEYYKGWTSYNEHADWTLADLADDLPELHAAIMDELRRLHKDKQLSIDPDSVKLEAYKDTPITGAELDKMDIQRLKQWMTEREGTPLDSYTNLDTTPRQIQVMGKDAITSEQENASIRSMYQKYAILQNVKERDVTSDGLYKMDFIQRTAYGPMFGYTLAKNPLDVTSDKDKDLVKRMARSRGTIILNAKILTMFLAWRSKAGQLLGLNKADEWQQKSQQLDLVRRYEMYEAYRSIYQLDDIQTYIADKGALNYIEAVQEATGPLYDETALDNMHEMTQEERAEAIHSHHPTSDMIAEWISQDTRIQKGLKLVEEMDLSSIASTADKLIDLQQELLEEYSQQ